MIVNEGKKTASKITNLFFCELIQYQNEDPTMRERHTQREIPKQVKKDQR